VETKKNLRFGFHYTWPGLSPKSNIVVVHATDLEHARTLVKAKVTELYPDIRPTCHWITMPQDHERNIAELAETSQIRQQHIWRTSIKIILVTLMLILVVGLMTSCNTHRFIQSSKNFRKKVDAYTLRLSGATTYRLEATSTRQDLDDSPIQVERK